MQDCSICDLYFTIRLWMADGGGFVNNMKFHMKLSEFFIIELSTIIDDDGMW